MLTSQPLMTHFIQSHRSDPRFTIYVKEMLNTLNFYLYSLGGVMERKD